MQARVDEPGLLLGLPPLAFEHLLQSLSAESRLSLFRSSRKTRDLVLQHTPRITYKPANTKHSTISGAISRAGGHLNLKLDVAGCADANIASLLAAASGSSAENVKHLHMRGAAEKQHAKNSAAWGFILGTALTTITMLHLDSIAITTGMQGNLAVCRQLSTLHLTGSTCLEATPDQAVLDEVLPAMLPKVSELRIDSPSLLPVLHALAPQLQVLLFEDKVKAASVVLSAQQQATFQAGIARCSRLCTARLYNIVCSTALFDSLNATPVSAVTLRKVKLQDSRGSSPCSWHLCVNRMHMDQLHKLPMQTLPSLTIECMGLSRISGAFDAWDQAVAQLMRARQLSIRVFLGIVDATPTPTLRALAGVSARIKPSVWAHACRSNATWTPNLEVLVAAAEGFAGHMQYINLIRAALTSDFWHLLQQVPQQLQAKLRGITLEACTELGAIGLTAYAAAMAMQPRELPLVVRLEKCNEQVVAAAREVQAALLQLPAPSRVQIEIVLGQ